MMNVCPLPAPHNTRATVSTTANKRSVLYVEKQMANES